MGLWKCLNEECDEQGQQFEGVPGDEGRCPHCRMLYCVELVAVHYLVPAEGPIKTSLGNRMIACDPKMKKLPSSASGDRRAVTCPLCRASTIFVEDNRDGISNHVPCIEFRRAEPR